MTYKEALKNMDCIENLITHSLGGYPYTEEESLMLMALDKALHALEKQIPKKPKNNSGHYTDNLCPLCGKRIKSGQGSSSRERTNWCNHCGQKIYWEE